MSNFRFDLSLKLSQGEVQKFSGEVRTSPHLPSKSGHGIKILNVRYIIIYKQILELETKTKIAQSFTHRQGWKK
jgi:hypothetical protein